jgi:ribosomal protein L15
MKKRRFLMTSALLGLAALHDPALTWDRSRSARFYTDGGEGGSSGSSGTGGGDGGNPGGGAAGGGSTSGASGAAPTLEQLQAQIAELTGKFGTTTKERDTLAAKLKEIEDAQLSEADKLKKAADEAAGKVTAAETRLRETLTRLEIERGARKLNIVDEDAAFRLLDASAIQYGDDGAPKNVQTLLEALVKAKPYLAGVEGGASGGGSSNPGRGRSGGDLTKADLAKMTPQQISLLPQDKVLAALAA